MARKAAGPPLRFRRTERKLWKGNLDIEALEVIEHYPAWHAQLTGEGTYLGLTQALLDIDIYSISEYFLAALRKRIPVGACLQSTR